MNKYTAREIALKSLYNVLEKGGYSNIVIKKYLDNSELSEKDKSFITEVTYGTIRKKITVDYIIEIYSKVKLKKVSPWILNLMRIAVYQMIFMDKVPDFAACGESVKLGRKYGHQAAVNYMNGVLRAISRNKESIYYPAKEQNQNLYLEKKYSYPEWLITRWIKQFGFEFTEEMLKYEDNREHSITVRVNQLKIEKGELEDVFSKEGVKFSQGKYSEEALIIEECNGIANLESYSKGFFQVQSESSMITTCVLNPQPNEFVIDVCSAPGGKVTHIAQKMKNKGHILARDIHEHKLKLIKQNTNRLGIDIIVVENFSAEQIDQSLIGKADRVLVDVPCTGHGVIGKKPDILINKKAGDIAKIAELQYHILNNSALYAKTGGIVVYSTCSIEPEENEQVVFRFLEQNEDFCLDSIDKLLPENMDKEPENKGYITFYPHIDGIDGFFIARLCRKGEK